MSLLLLFNSAGASDSPLDLNFLLSAIVERGLKTEEGDIIEAVAPAWDEIAKLVASDPKMMHQIDPRKWEELIAGWYKKAGFEEVTLTPRSGDYGRDVIAVKRGVLSIRIIDSVKHFAPHRVVSADDVRALSGVLHADQRATKGLVTTTSKFAPMIARDPFLAPLIPYRLELVDGEELARRLGEIAKSA